MLALDPFASINGDSINYIAVMWFFVAELGALFFVRQSGAHKSRPLKERRAEREKKERGREGREGTRSRIGALRDDSFTPFSSS